MEKLTDFNDYNCTICKEINITIYFTPYCLAESTTD